MAKLKVEYTATLPNPSGWATVLATLLLFGSVPAVAVLNQGSGDVQG